MWMVESSALEAVCATQYFPAHWGSSTEGANFFAHSYKLLLTKAQQRKLLVHFSCAVLPMLFHSGLGVFLISFPTFLVFLFSLLKCQAITMHCPLSYYFLLHTVLLCHCVQAAIHLVPILGLYYI